MKLPGRPRQSYAGCPKPPATASIASNTSTHHPFRVIVTLVRLTGRTNLVLRGYSRILPQIHRIRRNEREIRLSAVRIHSRQFFPPVGAADVETSCDEPKVAAFEDSASVRSRLLSGPDDFDRDIFLFDGAQTGRKSRLLCNCLGRGADAAACES